VKAAARHRLDIALSSSPAVPPHAGRTRSNQPGEEFLVKIISVGVVAGCVACAIAPARAEQASAQDFPLVGTYMQNVPCKGDKSDNAALKVKISPQQIVSNVGICTILDNKKDGNSYKIHVECKFPAGPLVGDLTFTPQPDKTIKFVDRDNTYNAVLHRCPD
jgi:hypothetical protein